MGQEKALRRAQRNDSQASYCERAAIGHKLPQDRLVEPGVKERRLEADGEQEVSGEHQD
jgi:hypothetical protein